MDDDRTTPTTRTGTPGTKNVVVLASGSGTLLQALLDAPDPKPYRVAAVGSDRSQLRRTGPGGRRRRADLHLPDRRPSRSGRLEPRRWPVLTASFNADLVVLAGFMKLVGPVFLAPSRTG